jgi:hypothetical protein
VKINILLCFYFSPTLENKFAKHIFEILVPVVHVRTSTITLRFVDQVSKDKHTCLT